MNSNRLLHYLTAATLAAVLCASCDQGKTEEPKASHADSVLFDMGTKKEYNRMLEVTDSFEKVGDITPLNANRWRGVAYYHEGQYRMSEVYYRKALDCKINGTQDQVSYNKAARRLSELLLVKGDYEGSFRIAATAVKMMDKSGIGSDIDYAIMLNNIGCCQLNLGRDEDANKSFLVARGHYANRWQSDSTGRGFQEAVLGTVYTSQAYINTRRYAQSIYWIDRTEMLLNKYREKPDARSEYFDEYQGRIEIMRGVALQGLGKEKEAREAYQRFLQTDYSKTGPGRINANDYLIAAQRYREAADNYRWLNGAMALWGTMPSLDNIQLYLLPKYRANVEAGYRDSAVIMGRQILGILDSCITSYKSSSTAELATIYDTQGKEAEIANKQAELNRQRLIGTGVSLILVIIFFVIYTLHKRKSTHRLAAAHQKLEEAHAKLKTAYDKLEETTAAKERIESELRIARDIQRSIVPSTFPHHKGLDLYAYMQPAKEVGGDLYDYLLDDDHLYICLGDVSGKGVPASLFMAQAARLFRAMAKQKMMPAEIATRLNDELCEGNENGMFVTMFLARINLSSGEMEFCNAGHNPPMLGNDFLEMETNAPIGLWPGLEFIGEHVDSIKGKPLFVYSDGLNEAENQQQEQFGDDHLLDILRTMKSDTEQHIIEFLTHEVERHRNGAAPNDDLTMMGLKLTDEEK